MFVSVNGKAKEVKELFVGGTDGLAHKVNEVFGSVDGVAKLIFSTVPHEKNGFDRFSWAEIKELADNGLLLEFFNVGDLVDVKFKEPINKRVYKYDVTQDAFTMQVKTVTATGMVLVAYTAVPFVYLYKIDNSAYATDRAALVSKGKTGDPEPEYFWGMCEGLYNGCKAIDNLLPDDMREVLHDYNPCHIWEYYTDDEGKKRFRQGYDDCRVHHFTTRGYKWHKEFVEENNREEYILDFSHFPTSEAKFKKYFPEEARGLEWYNKIYIAKSWKYKKLPDGSGYWLYDILHDDPMYTWNWDWENYNGCNNLYVYTETVNSCPTCGIVPQVQIGTIE